MYSHFNSSVRCGKCWFHMFKAEVLLFGLCKVCWCGAFYLWCFCSCMPLHVKKNCACNHVYMCPLSLCVLSVKVHLILVKFNTRSLAYTFISLSDLLYLLSFLVFGLFFFCLFLFFSLSLFLSFFQPT